jgi:hypothetical protein
MEFEYGYPPLDPDTPYTVRDLAERLIDMIISR